MNLQSNQDNSTPNNMYRVNQHIYHRYYEDGVITKIDNDKLYIKFRKGIRIFKNDLNIFMEKYSQLDYFKQAFDNFLKQADQNKISKKAEGKETIPELGLLRRNFGQGNASRAPYMNWYVVSIYYLTDKNEIIIGIAKNFLDDPSRHLDNMNFSKLGEELLGTNSEDKTVAVYYKTSRELLNYDELYKKFVDLCDEVQRVGSIPTFQSENLKKFFV